jgi:hypothetical protein
MKREDLVPIVEPALRHHGGEASIPKVAQFIWENHQAEIERSGKMLFTWQYDMRWAANKLRRLKKMIGAKISPRGIWQLV